MSTVEMLVLLGGVAGIAWVNWYFFLSESATARAAVSGAGEQEVEIVVDGGYTPSVVRVRRGVPVRLVFERRDDSGSSEEVVFGDFGIRRYLPAHERTVIELVPEAEGSYEFTCGMGLLRGRLVVE